MGTVRVDQNMHTDDDTIVVARALPDGVRHYITVGDWPCQVSIFASAEWLRRLAQQIDEHLEQGVTIDTCPELKNAGTVST